MTENNHPITLNIHVHQHSEKGLPKVNVVNPEYDSELEAWDDLEELDDEYTEGHRDENITIEMREQALQFYVDHFRGYYLEACFTDYKGMELDQLPISVASQCKQRIVDALEQLPVPPTHIQQREDRVSAKWCIPYGRMFLPFNDDVYCIIMNNFFENVATIGISTPKRGKISRFHDSDHFEKEDEQVREYFRLIKPLLKFDEMCGLRLTAENLSKSLVKDS